MTDSKFALQMLINPVYNPSHQTSGSQFAVHKQAFHSIAKCVAALTVKSSADCTGVVNQFVKDVKVFIIHVNAACILTSVTKF